MSEAEGIVELADVPADMPVDVPVEAPAEAPLEAPAEETKRARGRPPGARDVKPRKRKITIVEEPLATAPEQVPEVAPNKVEAPAVQEPPPKAPEPPKPEPVQEDSPRTIQHKAAELLIRLHRSKYDVRRNTLAETYAKGMMRV